MGNKSLGNNKHKQGHFSFLRCLFYFRAYAFIPLLLAGVLVNHAQGQTCPSAQQQLKQVKSWGQVKYIVDGDTLHLTDGRKIRLIGINTPELGRHGEASEPFAWQAYQAVVHLLADNKKVGLYYDKERQDRYKRTLAYVVLANGQSIEQSLLQQGLAISIVVPPNSKNLACYRALEQQARQAQKALWQLPEMHWLNAEKLSSKARGYRFIHGKVLALSESRKYIYLKLSDKLSVQIAKTEQKSFASLKALLGKQVRVRGWLNRYKGKQTLRLKVRENLQVLN